MGNTQGEGRIQSYRNFSKNEIKKKKFINDAKSAFKYTLSKTVKKMIILAIIIIVFLLFCSFSYYILLLKNEIIPKGLLGGATTSDITNTSDGEGYTGIYTPATLASEVPKRYREYKQILGSYKDHVWIRKTDANGNPVTSTIYRDGCCLTSIATIVSGYKNQDISPYDIVMEISRGVGYMSIFSPATALSEYGLTYSRPFLHNYSELSSVQKQAIINHVATGKPVIIYVLGPGNGGLSSFTSGQHWMAVLDYDASTDKLYVSNPSSTLIDKTGWQDSDYVLTSCTEYIAITN